MILLDTPAATRYAVGEPRIVHPLHNPRQAAALRADIATRDPGFTLMGGGVRVMRGGGR